MPNHCDNELKISGPIEELNRFEAGLKKDDDGNFSILRSWFPMPPELDGTKSPPDIVETKKKEYQHKGTGRSINTGRSITREESERFIKDYGTNNWYDWANKNWGTKWGDYDTTKKEYTKGLFFRFDSAWTPPIPAIERISILFPTLTFNLKFWECGAGVRGQIILKAGATIKQTEADYKGPRGG